MSLPNDIHPFVVAGGVYQYPISRSLRFRASNSAYLSRTPASNGNQKTFTMSAWIKRGKLGAAQGIFGSNYNYEFLSFNSTDNIIFRTQYSTSTDFVTTQVFRDTSAWYHIVAYVDTTQATESNRSKLWVNGVQITSFSAGAQPTQNSTTTDWNTNKNTPIGVQYIVNGPVNYFDGYMAEVYWIDGQALTPSSFGAADSVTGVWNPIKYTGTYGNNGFYLPFSDNSGATATTIGADKSGNGNNWTPSGISVTAGVTNDSFVDTPTNYGNDTGLGGEIRGNYATWSPISARGSYTFYDGNLRGNTGNGYDGALCSTIAAPSTGKWYVEASMTANYTASVCLLGLYDVSVYGGIKGDPSTYLYNSPSPNWTYYSNDGKLYYQNVQIAGTSTGSTWGIGDIIGIAWDAGAGTIQFYKNGVAHPSQLTGLTGKQFAVVAYNGTSGYQELVLNCGQRPFAYTAPSGFKALCTTNLPSSSYPIGLT